MTQSTGSVVGNSLNARFAEVRRSGSGDLRAPENLYRLDAGINFEGPELEGALGRGSGWLAALGR